MPPSRQGDTLRACQRGDLNACERLVQSYQETALRTAYLLTGDTGPAVTLARDAFLSLFGELFHAESDLDMRPRLLQIIAGRYLSRQPARSGSAIDASQAPDGGPQRFNVDDERSRVVAALARLDRPARALLVLHDFNGLDEADLAATFDLSHYDARAQVEAGRQRLRERLGEPDDRAVFELLAAAAFGAPGTGLWREIEEPLRRLQQRERQRQRRITLGIAGAVALLVVAGTLWLFGNPIWSTGQTGAAAVPETAATSTEVPPTPTPAPSPTPTTAPVSMPEADVPDFHLVNSWPYRNSNEKDGSEGSFVYDPGSNGLTNLFSQSASPVTMSPDGKWIIYQWYEAGEQGSVSSWEDRRVFLVALSSETKSVAWTAEIPNYVRGSIAATANRVYVVTNGEDDRKPPRIEALDITNGQEAGTWTVNLDNPDDLGSISNASFYLFSSLDGSRLYLGLGRRVSLPDGLVERTRILVSYSLPDLTVVNVNTHHTEAGAAQQLGSVFSFRSARPSPDGQGLYSVADGKVHFLEANERGLTTVDLPFPALPSGEPTSSGAVIANSGGKLYVIAPGRAAVAVVDLIGRRVERVFPIGSGEYHLLLADDPRQAGWFSAALSPDGSRLYLADIWHAKQEFAGTAGERAPVWVIDTSRWLVVDRWMVEGRPLSIHLSGDGGTAYVYSAIGQLDEETGRIVGAEPALTIFDTAGRQAPQVRKGIGLPEWGDAYNVTSPAALYRRLFGRRPVVDGVAGQDTAIESTRPFIRLSAGDEPVPAGGEAEVAARFINPQTGQPLLSEQPGIRYSPDASITVRLSHAENQAEDVILVPREADDEGYYRTRAVLEEPGWWDAQVLVTNPDGTTWQASLPYAVRVVPSFRGTDDRRYILRLTGLPEDSPLNEEIPVRAMFVDSETGERLPDGVELLEGMPEQIDTDFSLNRSGQRRGFTSRSLKPADHGVYEGTVTFWDPGVWTIDLKLPRPGDGALTVGGGKVEVGGE